MIGNPRLPPRGSWRGANGYIYRNVNQKRYLETKKGRSSRWIVPFLLCLHLFHHQTTKFYDTRTYLVFLVRPIRRIFPSFSKALSTTFTVLGLTSDTIL